MIILIILIFIAQCICIENTYSINLYGIKVASCKVEITDTIIYNKESIKLRYSVDSSNLMSYIFNVSNNYTTIIDKESYDILYFSKKTVQPKLRKDLQTININNKIFYNDDNYIINNDEFNIFSFLYVLSNDRNHLEYTDIIEREGKRYKYKVQNIDNNKFELFLDEINTKEQGLLKYTDIFSWALFLPNTKKIICLDKNHRIIKSCKFKKFSIFIC